MGVVGAGYKVKGGARGLDSSAVTATEAQNNFGRVLSRASRGETVYITKYDRAAAVVVSIERYRELTDDAATDLDELTDEFDAMLAGMQSDEAAAGFDALFSMDSAALGNAAVKGAEGDTD